MPPRTNKTKATNANVDDFIDKQPKEEVRNDCRALMKLMHELTGEAPYMYGPTIVGYGNYHYRYASGHEGDAPMLAFSPRKPEMVIYIYQEVLGAELMAKLGKHKATKGCVYVKRLTDINMAVLKTMLKRSISATLKAFPQR